MVKLPSNEPKLWLVTPFLVEPDYTFRPGAITIVTAPPEAELIVPACAAALQTAESSAYSSVPHTSET